MYKSPPSKQKRSHPAGIYCGAKNKISNKKKVAKLRKWWVCCFLPFRKGRLFLFRIQISEPVPLRVVQIESAQANETGKGHAHVTRQRRKSKSVWQYLGHISDGVGIVHQFALVHLDLSQRVDGQQKLALMGADPARVNAFHQFRVLVD